MGATQSMNQYIDTSKVYMDKSETCGGLGVFAKQDISKDEVVEVGLMAKLQNVDGNENPHLFTWSDDRKTWAIASGCLPWYNHSDEPNVKKVGDLENDTMKIVALRDIKKGEELRNTYMSKEWRTCFKDF